MKYSLAKFYNGKKLGLFIILFSLCFLLYRETKPLLSSLTTKKTSDSIPSPQEITQESEKKEIEPMAIDISQVSIDQLVAFANNDYNSPIFEKNGIKYEIFHQGKGVTHLQLSPDRKKLGFYLHYPEEEEEETVFGKTSLVIMDLEKRNFKEISEGNLRVSNWEWKNSNEFIIYINCGTGCHLAHVRSVKNGKLIAEYLDKQDQEY